MTMLEKMAAALSDADGVFADGSYLEMARAALMAIREVDQETYNAGWDAMSGEPDAGPGEPWLAMIDAILEGKA